MGVRIEVKREVGEREGGGVGDVRADNLSTLPTAGRALIQFRTKNSSRVPKSGQVVAHAIDRRIQAREPQSIQGYLAHKNHLPPLGPP